MKNLIFILMMFFTMTLRGQTRIDTLRGFITENLHAGEIKLLCDHVFEMALIASGSKDKETLREAGAYLFGDFDSVDIVEKTCIRKKATNIANMLSKMESRVDGPLPYFMLAHQYLEDMENGDTLSWYIENRIANIYTRLGDFQKATYFQNIVWKSLENAIRMFPDSFKYKEQFSRLHTDIATNLKSQRKWDESFTLYQKGLTLAQSIESPVGISANLFGLADVELERMNLPGAEKYLQLVEMILPRLVAYPRYQERESMYHRLNGQVKLKLGDLHASILSFEKAVASLHLAYANPKRREFGKLYEEYGEAYSRLDSLDQAEKLLYEGIACLHPGTISFETLPGPNHLYHENTFVEIFDQLNRLYKARFQKTGDTTFLLKSLHCIDLALAANDLIREAVLADPSRLITIADNKNLVRDGIEGNYLLYEMNPHAHYLADARKYFDRSKNLLLKDRSWRNQVRSIISVTDRGRLAEIDSSLLDLYHAHVNQEIDESALMAEFLSLKEKEENIYNRYKEVNLKRRTVNDYIEYAVFDHEVYAMASLEGKNYLLKLGSYESLSGLLKRADDHILLKEYSMDSKVLLELHQFLIAPFGTLPSHVVIIPDRELSFLPFDILQPKDNEYLIQQTTISYSNEYEQYQLSKPDDTAFYEIVCMAPSYEMPETKEMAASRGHLYHLKYARAEADSISSMYGSQGYTSVPKGKDDWGLNYLKAPIFHFAGHAIVNDDEAFLALGSKDEPHYKVNAAEISLMHHESDLVVLSACETGLGTIEKGEGVRSLGRSFIESGAKAAIMSLWNVNDKSTARIMTSFHRYLKNGMRKDDALRNAKLDYLNTEAGKARLPFYWGAFVALGNMEPLN